MNGWILDSHTQNRTKRPWKGPVGWRRAATFWARAACWRTADLSAADRERALPVVQHHSLESHTAGQAPQGQHGDGHPQVQRHSNEWRCCAGWRLQQWFCAPGGARTSAVLGRATYTSELLISSISFNQWRHFIAYKSSQSYFVPNRCSM